MWLLSATKLINHEQRYDNQASINLQVEEQFASHLHLHLHGAAALERATAADYEGQVVGAEFGVGVRCVGVGVAGGGEDCAALDSGFYSQ